MSAIKELAWDIEQLYIDGLSAAQIAQQLDCPLGVVKGWIEGNRVADAPQEEFDPFETINS